MNRNNTALREFRQNLRADSSTTNHEANNQMHAHVHLIGNLDFAADIIIDASVTQTYKV